ncbi:MAG: TrkA family potassium uptake protein [Planctomycetales bacterium]|nr:TrkA family potassium uptake protein [Planctomycetales bacterium]
MPISKHFVVIGLGSFGTALATRLAENGCRVTGIDAVRENVERLKEVIYEPVIGDGTSLETLQQLPIAKADAVFVGMGEEIAPSLLATLHCKQLGARRIIVKGVTTDHGKLLEQLGVERVIFPELEIARQIADRSARPNLLDFLPIDPEYSFVEFATPDSFGGKTLEDLALRKRFGIWVVGVKDVMSGKLRMFPDGQFTCKGDQVLLVVGKEKNLNRMHDET